VKQAGSYRWVGLRLATGEFCSRLLSVEFFQGECFLERQYIQEACNLTAETLFGLTRAQTY
jgi:hypothetical protein